MISKNITCIIAALLSAVLLCAPVSAAETVGNVPCMLTSWSGRGTLLDESSLGCAASDAVRLILGTDVAIVNGGDIPDNALQPGTQDEDAVRNAFANDRVLATAHISAGELFEILEAGVSHIIVDNESGELLTQESMFEGFPQVSGFSFRFDAAAEPGNRVLWVKLDDGRKLTRGDGDTKLSLAASEHLLSGGYEFPVDTEWTAAGKTLSQVMAEYISAGVSEDYSKVHRVSMVGGQTNSIISRIPAGAVLALLILLGAAGGLRQYRRRKSGDNNWDERYCDRTDKPLM